MKLTRLTTLAITAVAVAGTLGAQQRTNARSAPRAQASHAQAQRTQPSYNQAQRAQPARAYSYNRSSPAARPQQYANARADVRGRNDFGSRAAPARNEVRSRNDFDGRSNFRGDTRVNARVDARSVPVATHGRPLITRAGFEGARVYGRQAVYGGARFGAGFNRFGGRLVLPFGWESRLYVRGFFPASYMSYCEAVPVDYDYMLPPMLPNYDSCLFGDRIVVMDRFSRGIVFTTILQ